MICFTLESNKSVNLLLGKETGCFFLSCRVVHFMISYIGKHWVLGNLCVCCNELMSV